MLRTKTISGVREGRFLVFENTEQDPSDEDWEQAMVLYEEICEEEAAPGALIHTAGAAPNAAQRARLKEVTQGRAIRMAVLTASPITRTVGVAIRWFNPNFRMFAPNELERALDHLEANEEERTRLRAALGELLQLAQTRKVG
jgi:hypothetical protein